MLLFCCRLLVSHSKGRGCSIDREDHSATLGAMFRLRIQATASFLLFFWFRLWTAGAFSSSSSVFTRQQRIARSTTTALQAQLGAPICEYHQVSIPTSQKGVPPSQKISVEDLTPYILDLLTASGMQQGAVHVISRHTTTAITINERESRLARDMEEYFLSLAPPDERSVAVTAAVASTNSNTNIDAAGDHASTNNRRYYHNDIDQRPESEEEAQRCRENGWDIDNAQQLQAWRDQEPINAHSHLLSMLLGSSECIPVVDGSMVIGQWQSILLVDLDGPRDRTVGVQVLGYQ